MEKCHRPVLEQNIGNLLSDPISNVSQGEWFQQALERKCSLRRLNQIRDHLRPSSKIRGYTSCPQVEWLEGKMKTFITWKEAHVNIDKVEVRELCGNESPLVVVFSLKPHSNCYWDRGCPTSASYLLGDWLLGEGKRMFENMRNAEVTTHPSGNEIVDFARNGIPKRCAATCDILFGPLKQLSPFLIILFLLQIIALN